MNANPSDRASGRLAKRSVKGFLTALRRDIAGNTLAMMGAFAIPLAALAGSAVDMSRLYLVKARLQQACDAGVLAGRKVMTVTSGTLLDATAYSAANPSATPAHTAAKQFFDNNFPTGWMSTTNITFTPTRTSDSQVTATASATVPMAIMGMFGFGATAQTVTCTARLDIGDSDIMFVLDVTGSMGCASGAGCSSTSTYTRDSDGTTGYQIVEQSGSKISALRSAVKLFRTTLESNKPAAAHIRYGFVPYSSSVNVGALITGTGTAVAGKTDPGKAEYMVNTATYPSRELASDVYGTSMTNATTTAPANYNVAAGQYNQGDVNYGTATTANFTGITRATCLGKEARKSNETGTPTYAVGSWPTDTTKVVTRVLPVSAVSAASASTTTGNCTTYTWTVKPLWRYKQVTLDTATFKTFAAVDDPTKIDASTTKWQGCIEERYTPPSTTSTTFSSSSLPKDLDPDFVPNDDATRWRPLWPNVVYFRGGSATAYDSNGSSVQSSDVTTLGTNAASTPRTYSTLLLTTSGYGSSSYSSLGPVTQFYGCSAPAKRLDTYTAAQFDAYLDVAGDTGDFRPYGHTYHDVGMIWGLRLISPDGIWKADTAAWPGNNPPNRYIVFMTDGLMDPDPRAYHLYGLNQAAAGAAAAGTGDTDLGTIHNNRFQAVCQAAKDKNITVFVVAFDVGSTVPDNLEDCATPGFAYAATDSATLQTAFSTIALQIARLRLSQ